MKLLYTPNSPYSRKARIVGIEKHLDIELEQVDLTSQDCPVSQYNPLGKVPVLILDNEEALYDSRVIVEYLDARSPVTKLVPNEHALRIDVIRWGALADGISDAAVAAVTEKRKPKQQQSEEYIQMQMSRIQQGLAKLNRDISKKKWCVNETFSLADIAVGCMLGYINLRFNEMSWQSDHPELAKHFTILTKRPSFKETAPVG